MRVRCLTNSIDQLCNADARKRIKDTIHLDGPDENLVIGNIYDVYAIDRGDDGGMRVYLHSVTISDHPYPYPMEMFNIVDSSFPGNWVITTWQNQFGSTMKRISFPEWALDDHFFEKLVDGDSAALEHYRKQKSLAEHLGCEQSRP